MAEDARIPTNLRTLLILEALAEARRPLTPTELGRAVGLPKPTIHRLCTALLAEGFLTRDLSGKGVRPGRRARLFANGLLHSGVDTAARRQILTRVAETVRETVNFAAPAEDGMTYVDRVETDWAFRIQLPIGVVVPFHRTASGKTYLASLPPPKRRALIRTLDFSDGAPKAHKDADSLDADLTEVARRGYAIDDEELMEGMLALAVPVTDPSGDYAAALAFHGPSQRLSVPSLLEGLETLRSAARQLSDLMF